MISSVAFVLCISALLISAFLFAAAPVDAQINRVIYMVTIDRMTEQSHVITLDPVNGDRSIIFSAPFTAVVTADDLFSQKELDFHAQTWHVHKRGLLGSISSLHIQIIVGTITPSPDNRSVIIEVTYQFCISQIWECFGVQHLVVVDRVTSQQRVVYTKDIHLETYYEETGIYRVGWLPNQQGWVVEVSGLAGYRSLDTTFFIVPANGRSPFEVGIGRTWTVAPTSDQIAVLSPDQGKPASTGTLNTIRLVDFDLNVGVTSAREHVFGSWYIWDQPGLVYLDSVLVFQRAFDYALSDLDPNRYGLAMLDIKSGSASLVLPSISIVELQSTGDGSIVIAERGDGMLVNVTYDGYTLHLEEISDIPVADWQIDHIGNLTVQHKSATNRLVLIPAVGGRYFSVVDVFDLALPQRDPRYAEIVSIEW